MNQTQITPKINTANRWYDAATGRFIAAKVAGAVLLAAINARVAAVQVAATFQAFAAAAMGTRASHAARAAHVLFGAGPAIAAHPTAAQRRAAKSVSAWGFGS
jgi:hypothetical protein